ncbi:MAG TPA: class I adenylate-forming enzyme family protein [Thermodesulfobacteriota bacterium]|jgi:long-chain acyl-CoA synthetase
MTTVFDLFSSTLNKYENKTAVVDIDRRVTYGTLGFMVRSLASFLISKGIRHGDRVAILLPNSIEFITSFFSIASLGAVSLPLNTAYKQEECRFYVSDSQIKLLITEEKLKSIAENATVGLDVSVVVIKGSKRDWSFVRDENLGSFIASIKSSDEALYLYSTGSTGRPKRVLRTHFNLIVLADNHTETVGSTEKDRILFVVPLAHTYGFGNFISAVKSGASIYVLEEFNRNKVADLIERESISVFPAVPFILNVMAETFSTKSRDFSSLKLVISAGAPLSRQTFFKFHERFGVYPRQLYGSTETGVISINLSEDIENNFDSVGRPIKNVEVKVFREDGSEANVNEVGEIAVKSPSMTTGYYGLPELTKRVFKNGYYFTEDLGRIDNKGYIYIIGRKKLFINVAGNKVDPTEIENFLMTHPKIKEVVVLGSQDNYGNESVKAVIVPKEDIDIKEIYNYCKDRVADFKVPRVIELRKEIPKSPTGKVLREYLK